MKIADIKPGKWYATKFGIGECLGDTYDNGMRFRIDGESRFVSPRDVYGEAKKPEVTP